MLNTFGDRKRALALSARQIKTSPNFKMRWGTVFEDTSGFVFKSVTGLEYTDLGSIAHETHSYIRGSVDGANAQKDFILETKSPADHVPCPKIENEYYLYQVLQNIEILDASFGLFNNVQLLPVPTGLFDLPDKAIRPCFNSMTDVQYYRYNLANASEVYTIECDVIYVGKPKPSEYKTITSDEDTKYLNIDLLAKYHDPSFNFADLFNINYEGKKHNMTIVPRDECLFNTFIMCERYKVVPVRVCPKIIVNDRTPNKDSVGRIFLRVGALNIEIIKRNKQYWETVLVPVCQRWIADLEIARIDPNKVEEISPVVLPQVVD